MTIPTPFNAQFSNAFLEKAISDIESAIRVNPVMVAGLPGHRRYIADLSGRGIGKTYPMLEFAVETANAYVSIASEAYLLPDLKLFSTVMIALGGDEVEVISEGSMSSIIPDLQALQKSESDFYKSYVHHIVEFCMLTGLRNLGFDFEIPQKHTKSTRPDGFILGDIVDLFSGSGFWTERLAKDKTLDRFNLHLVDNHPSVVQGLYGRLGHYDDVFIHQIDLLSHPDPLKGLSPWIVTAIGGLDYATMTRPQALELSTKVYSAPRPGGVFIATSKHDCPLNSDDFQRIGYEVVNKGIPTRIAHFELPEQLYMLRKPDSRSLILPYK